MKKSHAERSGERKGHGTSLKREMRCPGNMFRTMAIDSAPLLQKWPTQRKRMPITLAPPPAYLLSTTHSKVVRFPWATLYFSLPNFIYTLDSSTCSRHCGNVQVIHVSHLLRSSILVTRTVSFTPLCKS
jgi:hypothetical protein